MFSVKLRKTLTFKLASIAAVVAFIFTSIDVRSLFARDSNSFQNLATQSIYRPAENGDYTIAEWAKLDVLCGARMLLKGEESKPYSVKKVNLALETLFEARKRATRRESWAKEALTLGPLQFTYYDFIPAKGENRIVAGFIFLNQPDKFYRITYKSSGDYDIKSAQSQPLPPVLEEPLGVRMSSSGEIGSFKDLTNSIMLADADCVITSFTASGKDPEERTISDEAIEAIGSLSKRNIRCIGITDEAPEQFISRCGGQAIAKELSGGRRKPYAVLGYNGSSGNIINGSGQLEPMSLYTKKNFDMDIKRTIENIVEQRMKENRFTYSIELTPNVIRAFILNRSTKTTGYEELARSIRRDLEKKRTFLKNLVVRVRDDGIEIYPVSRRASVIEIIKKDHLQKVILIDDSVGTKDSPLDGKGILSLDFNDLLREGVEWDVELVKFYTGSDKKADLPADVYTLKPGTDMADPIAAIHKAVGEARDFDRVMVEIARYLIVHDGDVKKLRDKLKWDFQGERALLEIIERIDFDFMEYENYTIKFPYLADTVERRSYNVIIGEHEFKHAYLRGHAGARREPITAERVKYETRGDIDEREETTLKGINYTMDSAISTLNHAAECAQLDKHRASSVSDLLDIKDVKRLIVVGQTGLDVNVLESALNNIGKEFSLTGDTHMLLLGNVLEENLHRPDSEKRFNLDERNRIELLLRIAQLKRDHPDNFHILAGKSELDPSYIQHGRLAQATRNFVGSLPMFALVHAGKKRYLLSHGLNLYCGNERNFAHSPDGALTLRPDAKGFWNGSYDEMFMPTVERFDFYKLTSLRSLAMAGVPAEELKKNISKIIRYLDCMLIDGDFGIFDAIGEEKTKEGLGLTRTHIDGQAVSLMKGLRDRLYIMESSGSEAVYLDITVDTNDNVTLSPERIYPAATTGIPQILQHPIYSFGPARPTYVHRADASSAWRPEQIAVRSMQELFTQLDATAKELSEKSGIDLKELEKRVREAQATYGDMIKEADRQWDLIAKGRRIKDKEYSNLQTLFGQLDFDTSIIYRYCNSSDLQKRLNELPEDKAVPAYIIFDRLIKFVENLVEVCTDNSLLALRRDVENANATAGDIDTEVLKLVQRYSKKHPDVNLIVDTSGLDKSTAVRISLNRLFYLMDTLIANAAMNNSAVTLRLVTAKMTGELMISVQGMGKGIDPAYFEPSDGGMIRLFDIETSNGAVYIDMARVAKIIDIAGGTIEVRSDPGKGAIVTACIPPSGVKDDVPLGPSVGVLSTQEIEEYLGGARGEVTMYIGGSRDDVSRSERAFAGKVIDLMAHRDNIKVMVGSDPLSIDMVVVGRMVEEGRGPNLIVTGVERNFELASESMLKQYILKKSVSVEDVDLFLQHIGIGEAIATLPEGTIRKKLEEKGVTFVSPPSEVTDHLTNLYDKASARSRWMVDQLNGKKDFLVWISTAKASETSRACLYAREKRTKMFYFNRVMFGSPTFAVWKRVENMDSPEQYAEDLPIEDGRLVLLSYDESHRALDVVEIEKIDGVERGCEELLANPNGKVYFITSDTHGTTVNINSVVQTLHNWRDREVLINGDRVDRGPVWRSPKNWRNARLLAGNEDIWIMLAGMGRPDYIAHAILHACRYGDEGVENLAKGLGINEELLSGFRELAREAYRKAGISVAEERHRGNIAIAGPKDNHEDELAALMIYLVSLAGVDEYQFDRIPMRYLIPLLNEDIAEECRNVPENRAREKLREAIMNKYGQRPLRALSGEWQGVMEKITKSIRGGKLCGDVLQSDLYKIITPDKNAKPRIMTIHTIPWAMNEDGTIHEYLVDKEHFERFLKHSSKIVNAANYRKVDGEYMVKGYAFLQFAQFMWERLRFLHRNPKLPGELREYYRIVDWVHENIATGKHSLLYLKKQDFCAFSFNGETEEDNWVYQFLGIRNRIINGERVSAKPISRLAEKNLKERFDVNRNDYINYQGEKYLKRSGSEKIAGSMAADCDVDLFIGGHVSVVGNFAGRIMIEDPGYVRRLGIGGFEDSGGALAVLPDGQILRLVYRPFLELMRDPRSREKIDSVVGQRIGLTEMAYYRWPLTWNEINRYLKLREELACFLKYGRMDSSERFDFESKDVFKTYVLNTKFMLARVQEAEREKVASELIENGKAETIINKRRQAITMIDALEENPGWTELVKGYPIRLLAPARAEIVDINPPPTDQDSLEQNIRYSSSGSTAITTQKFGPVKPDEEMKKRSNGLRSSQIAFRSMWHRSSSGMDLEDLNFILKNNIPIFCNHINLDADYIKMINDIARETGDLYQELKRYTSEPGLREDGGSEKPIALLKDMKLNLEALKSFIISGTSVVNVMKKSIEELSGRDKEKAMMEFTRLQDIVEQFLEYVEDRVALAERRNVEGTATSFFSIRNKLIEAHKGLVDIKVALPADEALIPMSQVRLFSLLNNLVDNAIEHNPHGTKVTVEIGMDKARGELEIKVSDKGRGFSAGDFNKIGNKGLIKAFILRGDGKRVHVGMAEVWDIVGISGGTIKGESKEGRGTIFTIKIPIKDIAKTEDGRIRHSSSGIAMEPLIWKPEDAVFQYYAWGGKGIASLLGLGEKRIAEIWFNSTHKDSPSKVPNQDYTLAKLIEENPEAMLGKGVRSKDFFAKVLGKAEDQPQIVHMGFNERIKEAGKERFISWLVKERRLMARLKDMLAGFIKTEGQFNEYKAAYENWVSAQVEARWESESAPILPDFMRGLDSKIFGEIRSNRKDIVSVLNEIGLKPGQVILSPVGYIHSIVGSHQMHPPSEHPDAKNEAWYIFSIGKDEVTGKERLLYFEPQQTSNTTYSPFDFPTPIIWKDDAPSMRKNLTKGLDALLGKDEAGPASEEAAIRIMCERALKFESSRPEDFVINNKITDVTDRYEEPHSSKVEALIEGAYPVWPKELFTLHRIMLTGKGQTGPASIVVKPLENLFHEVIVLKGEVRIIMDERDELLVPGSSIFVPAYYKKSYRIESFGEAEVLKLYPASGRERTSSGGLKTAQDLDTLTNTVNNIIYMAGNELRKTIETKLSAVTEQPMHLVFIRDSIPEGQPSVVQGYIQAWRNKFVKDSRSLYTVDIKKDVDSVINLLSNNPDWNRTNTIIAVDSFDLKALEENIKTDKLEGKAKILNIGAIADDELVLIDTYLNLMATLVRINEPLRDEKTIDRLRSLFEYLGVGGANIERFIKDITTEELFRNSLFILNLPPVKPIKTEDLQRLYEATKPVDRAA